MNVLIIDYGMGNIASIVNAVKVTGATPLVSADPSKLDWATHAILPGQGAFKDGMQSLRNNGWIEPLTHYAIEQKRPLLGICLGMQLLADRSYEAELTQGLGFITGEVVKLNVTPPKQRLPHVGWNTANFVRPSVWVENIHNGADFYFVHSFHFKTQERFALGVTEYGETFTSMISTDNILGVQFHPEKSAQPGRLLLKNFLNATPC